MRKRSTFVSGANWRTLRDMTVLAVGVGVIAVGYVAFEVTKLVAAKAGNRVKNTLDNLPCNQPQ